MTRSEFTEFIKKGPIILDGATGSNLMAAGMPQGACTEKWVLDNPDVLVDLQKRYVEAGSNIIYAPTFTGNRIKLAEYGLDDRLEEINMSLVALSKKAADGKALVAGDMTMTGQQLYPLGDLEFDELVDIYKEQATALDKAGVDLFIVETMMSLQECRAAVLAIKEVSELPIMVSLSYDENGRTLFGTPADVSVAVLQAMGADVVGINCSTGPEQMVQTVEKMAKIATVPIMAKPNAGLPELEDGVAVYKMQADDFAKATSELVKAGAAVVGGCCGTTPDHIKALASEVKGMEIISPLEEPKLILASEKQLFDFEEMGEEIEVGYQINASTDEDLQDELPDGIYDTVTDLAFDQIDDGANVIAINVDLPDIDMKEAMKEAIFEFSTSTRNPVCVVSSDLEVIEEGLKAFIGRAMVKLSDECADDADFGEKKAALCSLAEKYGAVIA